MADKLRYDLTIADIRSRLKYPEHYVLSVLRNMEPCRRQRGDAFVKIGLSGSGAAPHYRIGPPDDNYPMEDLLDLGGPAPTDTELAPFFVAYNGLSHKRIEDWGFHELRPDNWSTGSMSFADVQALLGDIRGFTPKR